ncbi:hypothetical protein LTR17_019673 [Elasticomyces elasticus]|nr:hypothetical protein LTR17_019673 [Elasticomyces elasticus]
MHFSTVLLSALITTAACKPVNTTRAYNLETRLKPHHAGKKRFDKLYLHTWSTASDTRYDTKDPSRSTLTNVFSDAVFYDDNDYFSAKGFLSPVTNSTVADDNFQEFDQGTDGAYVMTMVEAASYYAAWQSVRLRLVEPGYTTSSPDAIENGFFINATGLQWTSAPGQAGTSQDSFGGWLVCDWWDIFPQLFFRNKPQNYRSIPKNCAEVYLMPKYI